MGLGWYAIEGVVDLECFLPEVASNEACSGKSSPRIRVMESLLSAPFGTAQLTHMVMEKIHKFNPFFLK